MNDKSQLEAMSKKYKAEMMRLYSKSASAKSAHNSQKPAAAPRNMPPHSAMPQMPPTQPMQPMQPVQPIPPMPPMPPDIPQNNAPMEEEPFSQNGTAFPNPDDILAAEADDATAPSAPMTPNGTEDGGTSAAHLQGNYDFLPFQEPISQEDSEELFPSEISALTGRGILQVEVSAANNAYPIPDATVIITKNAAEGNVMLRLLYTDISGKTPAVELPAPNSDLTESPETAERSSEDYLVSVYAKGYYSMPEITVPIFSTVKSIQPVTLIPISEGEV